MLDNTKQALKNIGSDVANLAKDICIRLPKAVVDDGRAHLEVRKEFLEWRKARNTKAETPADAQ